MYVSRECIAHLLMPFVISAPVVIQCMTYSPGTRAGWQRTNEPRGQPHARFSVHAGTSRRIFTVWSAPERRRCH